MEKIYSLCLIIAIVSFLGFCVENVWLAITKGYMNNRNMYLPFLLGYGLAIVAIYAIFGTPQTLRFFHWHIEAGSGFFCYAIYFVFVSLCVMIGEIVLGTFVEKTCGIVWWNYSRLPLHITKYTSVPTTVAFGTLITVFMGCFFTPLHKFFCGMEIHTLGIIAVVLMLLMTMDFVHSGIRIYIHRELLQLWQINFPHIVWDECLKRR